MNIYIHKYTCIYPWCLSPNRGTGKTIFTSLSSYIYTYSYIFIYTLYLKIHIYIHTCIHMYTFTYLQDLSPTRGTVITISWSWIQSWLCLKSRCVHSCGVHTHVCMCIYIRMNLAEANGVWRGGGLESRPTKIYGERLGDGVEYHLMSPTPRC